MECNVMRRKLKKLSASGFAVGSLLASNAPVTTTETGVQSAARYENVDASGAGHVKYGLTR